MSDHLFPRFERYGAAADQGPRGAAVRRSCARVAQDLGVPERLREAPAATGRSVEMLVESERVLASGARR